MQHHAAVSHTVVVLATGLLPEHLGLPPLPPSVVMPFPTTPPAPASPSDKQLRARLPTIPKLFTYGCPTRAPGDQRRLHSVMNTLMTSPLPESIKKQREKEIKKLNCKYHLQGPANPKASFVKGVESTPLLYVLTPNQLVDNGYKLPSYVEASDRVFVPGEMPERDAAILAKAREIEMGVQGPSAGALAVAAPNNAKMVVVNEVGQRTRGNVRAEEGWVETPRAQGPPPGGEYPVLAIDCEMVSSISRENLTTRCSRKTDKSSRACQSLTWSQARRSSTSSSPHQSGLQTTSLSELIDQECKADDRYSGMTEERLSKSKHTLESVQEALVTGSNPVITPHTILLGHSLDCDMAQLKIRHPLIVDTTVIYRHPRGPPYKPSLKWLTQKWLGRKIQERQDGHDSREDARACVDLLRMKLVHGT